MARTLKAYVHVGGQVYKPGDSPSKDVAEQITNPRAWGESSTADGDGGTETSYSDMKVAELVAMIEQRNESREDDAKLSTDGKKADLVAALEADDENQADS